MTETDLNGRLLPVENGVKGWEGRVSFFLMEKI